MAEVGAVVRAWIAELRRRKVFRVAAVYLVVAWLVLQVADVVFDPLGLPSWSLKLVILVAVLGFPLACAVAWAFDVTPRGIERTPDAAPAGLPDRAASTVPLAAAPLGLPAAAPAESVAILPFTDLSPGRDNAYFCDGIADEIINALCCVRGLRIASRTSSFQYRDRAADVRDIGRALNVGAVLEGSVRKAGDRVRITAQLVGAADGYHLWSESFDRSLDDVFATQTEIAQKLVRALRVTLSREERELIERRGTANATAYDYYLRGQAQLRDGSDTALPAAASLFGRAVESDPQFAQAHAGLANALAYSRLWGVEVDDASIELALAASRRALELEPRLPEAFVAKANLLFMQGRAAESYAAFDEAIRLSPASYDAHYFYARNLFSAGRAAQAVPYYQVAERLRPEEYQPPCMLASALYSLQRNAEADAAAARALHAVDVRLAGEPDDSRAVHLGAVLAARLGQRERALGYVERALQLRPDEFATLYNCACTYAVLRMDDEALAMLDHAVGSGRGDLGWIEHDPDFEPLRGDPRFAAVIARLRSRA